MTEATPLLTPSGAPLSRLCLGTMMFGDQTDAALARAMADRFAAWGGNFIDTADAYAGGQSESITGQIVSADRDAWFVATKVGNPAKGRPGTGGLSAKWIAEALDASLDRLEIGTVDLYYLHQDDETTPLDETIAALGQAIADGRIRNWGFSNFRGWKIAEMVRIADRLGVARPRMAQPYYHALYRAAEVDYLPACAHFGIHVVPYSPLARGALTGKYSDGIPEGSRAGRGDKRIAETELRPDLLAAARELDTYATDTGRRMADLALRWVLANRTISSVLIGPKDMAQLDAYLAGPETAFSAEDEARFEAIVPTGGVVGLYSDPRYPFRGRVTGGESP